MAVERMLDDTYTVGGGGYGGQRRPGAAGYGAGDQKEYAPQYFLEPNNSRVVVYRIYSLIN